MELLLFQQLVDPDLVKTILTSIIAAVPGWLAFYIERKKRKVNLAKDELDYIKVSQEEIIEVYDQLKEAKREIIKVEKALHEKSTDLAECLDAKLDCHECQEESIKLIREAESLLAQATTYELPELLKHLDAMRHQFSAHRSQNEQLNISDRSSSPS